MCSFEDCKQKAHAKIIYAQQGSVMIVVRQDRMRYSSLGEGVYRCMPHLIYELVNLSNDARGMLDGKN